MIRYKYTATFSTGDTITRNTRASYGKAWAVIEDNKLVASGFAVRAKSLDYVFNHPRSIVEVINPERVILTSD